MEVHLNRAPLYRPEKSFLSRKNGRIFCIYSPSDFSCAMFIQICRSPRRKRFRLVSAEQRQTEERDFRSWPRTKWSESAKMKEGEGKKENRRQTPSPLFYSPHFRAVFDSRSSFFATKLHGNACYTGLLCRKTGYEWPRAR